MSDPIDFTVTLEDLNASAPVLARAVSNVGTYQDHLTAMSELNALLRRGAQHQVAPEPRKEERSATVGSFVTYWDPKKGSQQAHVLEVQAEGRLKIRCHQTAKPDYNVDNVPHSEKSKKGHWSYR